MMLLRITCIVLVTFILHAQGSFISNLQVEGLISPLAIPNIIPRFSWTCGSNASYQLSYRIIVQNTWPISSNVWDSGTITSANQWLIPYNGNTLVSNADYTWSVEVNLFGIGMIKSYSTFSTSPSLLYFSDTKWLGGSDTMRTSFLLSSGQALLRARFHVTAAGCYHAYVNGKRISLELSPGFSHAPSARMPYDSYDVSNLLRVGYENVLGLRIGSCKFGTYNQYCKGTPSQCNVGLGKLELILEEASGEINITSVTTSAKTWTATNTSIVYQHLYNGEIFDARLEQEGWNSPDFTAIWPAATEVDTSDLLGPLEPSRMAPINRGDIITPQSVTKQIDGSFVFDVGHFLNMAGFCSLDVRPPIGQVPVSAGVSVSLLHGEILYPNGTVDNYFINTGNCPVNCAAMNFTYITRGSVLGEIESAPHFSYFGFRYVQLYNWPYSIPPTTSVLKCYFTHSELSTTIGLVFPNNPVLQLLQNSVVRTHLSNFVSLPTDCPQREKRGWSGDGQLTTHSATLNFGILAFYENWHRSMLDQQRIGCLPSGEIEPSQMGKRNVSSPIRPFNWACNKPNINNLSLADYQFGTISDVVPMEQQGMGYFTGDPSWEVAAVVVPYELLTQLADLDYVESNYDGPKALVKWFNILGNADNTSNGLITWSYLGDWKALDTPDNKLVANSNYAMATLFLAEIASAIGNKVDAATYLALFTLLSTSMRNKWFNTAKPNAWDEGSQSAQALCLEWEIGGNETTDLAINALISALEKTNDHLTVGASGARVILDVLERVANRPDLALALAQQTTFPSWGFFVSNASYPGTFWEEWTFETNGNSDNHIFHAGGITSFLTEAVLGLDFAMRPRMNKQEVNCVCEESLDLAFSASIRFGLSCVAIDALCEVVHKRRLDLLLSRNKGQVYSLDSIRNDIKHSFSRRSLATEKVFDKGLEARVGLSVSTRASSLGNVSGWRSTPIGNITWTWVYNESVLYTEANIPDPSVSVVIEFPLSLFSNAKALNLTITFVDINDEINKSIHYKLNLLSMTLSNINQSKYNNEFDVELASCGVGVARSNVDGRRIRKCLPAILLRRNLGAVNIGKKISCSIFTDVV